MKDDWIYWSHDKVVEKRKEILFALSLTLVLVGLLCVFVVQIASDTIHPLFIIVSICGGIFLFIAILLFIWGDIFAEW